MKKLFNNWISRNFSGLSAHTLFQFLVSEYGFDSAESSNLVYCSLFNVFRNNYTETEYNAFTGIQSLVMECGWL